MVAYLIPPKTNATAQGEHVFFDIDVKGGERTGVPFLPSMPKGEIVGMFYRQCMLFIDDQYNKKDGNKRAKVCRQVIDDKIRVSIDEK